MRLKIADAAAPAFVRATQAGRRVKVGGSKWALLSLLAAGILYMLAASRLPPDAFTYHDEGAKYLQVRNLRITPSGLDWSINYPARRVDPALKYVPFHPKQHYIDSQGRIYLQWPIFLGLLTRLFWKVFGFGGLYVVPLISGLGTLWASYLLALAVGLPRRTAWLVVPLVGLATPVALFSLIYFEHTLAAMLVALSMLAAVRSVSQGEHSARMAGLSGTLLAVAVYFRSELYVPALVTFLVYLYSGLQRHSWKLTATWLLTFGIALVPLWGFYAITEGTLLPTHALWYFSGGDATAIGGIPKPGLPPLRYIATAGWGVIPAFLFGPENVPLAPSFPVWVELSGIVGVALCALAALGRVLRGRIARWALPAFSAGMLLLLVSTSATLLSPQAYYNLHGFVLASPFVILALWPSGAGFGRKSRSLTLNSDTPYPQPPLPTPGERGHSKGGIGGHPHAPVRGYSPAPLTETRTLGSQRGQKGLSYGEVGGQPHAHVRDIAPAPHGNADLSLKGAEGGVMPPNLFTQEAARETRRFLYAVTWLYVVLHALVISALSGLGPISLHEWGQRYLLPAYPLLAVLALAGAYDIFTNASSGTKGWIGGSVVAMGLALCLVGAGFVVRGYGVLLEERRQVEVWIGIVRQLPAEDPVVTDVWWLPLDLAASFYPRPFMLAEGDTKLREWAGDMRTRGVTHFSMATTDPAHLQGEWSRGVAGLTPDGPPASSDGVWVQRFTLTR